jgi:hypothetical protein
MTTRSTPGGSKFGHVRKHSRHTRLTRLRFTAEPTLPLTTKPIRGRAASDLESGCRATRRVKCGVATLRPVLCARTNSACLRSLRSCPNVKGGIGLSEHRAEHRAPGAVATSCRSLERGACGLCAGGSRALCGRPAWPCERESRACARGECCAAGRCASWFWLSAKPWRRIVIRGPLRSSLAQGKRFGVLFERGSLTPHAP